MQTQTQSQKGGNPSAETDLQKDQNLYDLEYCENLSKMTGEQVFQGGHNLYRIYNEDGGKIVYLSSDEMHSLIDDFEDALTQINFREFWGEQ